LSEPPFNERVISAVTRSLDSKYGEGVRQVIVWRFQDRNKLEISDIPTKPGQFVDCIRQIFGTGSGSIERTITEEMCREFKIAVPGDPDFVKAVELAKTKRLKESLTES
jgi:hypothetical protein